MTERGATRQPPSLRRTQRMGSVDNVPLAARCVAYRLTSKSNLRRGLLVFVVDDGVYAVRPDSQLGEQQRAAAIVGCYRGNASARQIEDDLRAWSGAQ